MEHVVAGPPDSNDRIQSIVLLSPEAKSSDGIADDGERQKTAKLYNRTKIILGIGGTIFFFGLTVALVVSGLSKELDSIAHTYAANDYLALLIFVTVFGLAETILALPLSFYSGYYLEHKYRLSNQTFFGWIWEGLKGMFVSIPLAVPILLAFYFCLRSYGPLWWLPVGTVLFLLTVVLARLAPVLIFPLFYKFVPIDESPMKEKILTLCRKVGVAVEGIFTFNLSKNTKKANAAITGIGKSKRIVLGDTLVQNFTDEEVATVFAHELGHFKMRHIWVMMAIGTLNSFLGLFLTAQLYEMSLPWLGFARSDQIGALPLLSLWLGLYSMLSSPISNHVSRKHEYSADKYAVRMTGDKGAFVRALTKLASINLADPTPPPMIEFLFHSHPSISKRIRAIESMGG